MSHSGEIITEENTFEEINNAYELDAVEYDENDEETVEYLELDLEMDQVGESAKEYIPEILPSRAQMSVVQSSVFKPSHKNAAKLKHKKSSKLNRTKQQTAITQKSSILQVLSATENSNNSNSMCQAAGNTASVHAAVNVINAKLADSAQAINGQGRNDTLNERVEFNGSANDDSQAFRNLKSDIKCEGDSLDLFFQSMAQTVLHLPPQVQAKIKMDIYKVIARAEIKYGISITAQNQEV